MTMPPRPEPQSSSHVSRSGNASEHPDSIFETFRHLVGDVRLPSAGPGRVETKGAVAPLAALPSWLKLYAAIAELRGAQAVAFDLALNRASIDLPLGAIDPAADGAGRPLPATNVIHAHRGLLCAIAESPRDRMKIDIVSMLFDHILADDKVPAAIRNLLARLQWPVLRIALGDVSFFATRAHPTRRLMDRVASCAVGWRADSEGGGKLRIEIERIARIILHDTTNDVALYEVLLNEFERFLDEARNASGDLVCRAADVLQRVEAREVLAINATIQVNQFLYGIKVEPFLRSFLLDVWSRVLVETACRAADPKTDAAVARAKRVCLDLVWSAGEMTSDADRQRLGALWPKLSRALRNGLALIGYPASDQARFFARLMAIHPELLWERAVTGASSPPQSGDTFASKAHWTEHTASDFDGFAARLTTITVGHDVDEFDPADRTVDVSTSAARRAIAEAGEVRIDVLSASGASPAGETMVPGATAAQNSGARANANEKSVASWIDALEKGNWLELTSEEGARKIRLAWISPMKSFYLFISADGQQAHSLDRSTLDAMFKRRELNFVEDEPLIDRAVRGVMVQLQPKQSDR